MSMDMDGWIWIYGSTGGGGGVEKGPFDDAKASAADHFKSTLGLFKKKGIKKGECEGAIFEVQPKWD
jgi:hypothetical protein